MHRYIFVLVATVLAMGLGAAQAGAQTSYDTSPGGQTGVQVFGSYFAADIDTVSIYNGNLNLSIPLFSLPGRELPYGLALTYNAQKWEQDYVSGAIVGRYTGGWIKSNVFGDTLSFFADYESGCTIYWIDGAGTKHRYVPHPEDTWCIPPDIPTPSWPEGWNNHTLISMDSDGSTLWTGTYQTNGSDAARINFKNGHILYFRTPNSSIPYDYVTPNGNYLIKSTNASGLPAQDTLGRSVGYSCPACGPTATNWTETYTVTDSNNQPQTYVLAWSKTTVMAVPTSSIRSPGRTPPCK
jgi:hypothetical protein